MASLSIDVNGRAGASITQSEMQALLEPLHNCLRRMEGTLQELSIAVPFHVQQEASQPTTELAAGNEAKSAALFDSITPVVSQDEPVGQEQETEPPSPGIEEVSMQKQEYQNLAHRGSIAGGVMDVVERHKVDKLMKDYKSGEQLTVSVFDRVFTWLDRCFEWWGTIQEPDSKFGVINVIRSRHFESACMVAICLNGALVAYAADWKIEHIGENEPIALRVLESGFVVFFLLELILRLCAHGRYFFLSDDMLWNIFDFFLVSISIMDFVFETIVHAQGGSNIGFMRLLRLLKLGRIFRTLRTFRFFKSLALLLESFQRSFITLFWGFVMLAFVLYLFSLIFMQALIEYLTTEDSIDPDLRFRIESNFGSLGLTILALYKSVTGGEDWGRYYDIMVEPGLVYGLLFVMFTFFFLFAIFNILTGTLVEKAMSANKPDRAELILNERKALASQSQDFLEVCKLMDTSHDGKISWVEFQNWMRDPVIVSYIASIGIEIHDIELFFSTVSTRSGRSGRHVKQGEVTIEHFVEGCMHMKGTATAIDMQRQLFEMHVMHHDLKQFEASFTNKLQWLEHVLGQTLISDRHAMQRLKPPEIVAL